MSRSRHRRFHLQPGTSPYVRSVMWTLNFEGFEFAFQHKLTFRVHLFGEDSAIGTVAYFSLRSGRNCREDCAGLRPGRLSWAPYIHCRLLQVAGRHYLSGAIICILLTQHNILPCHVLCRPSSRPSLLETALQHLIDLRFVWVRRKNPFS
jgi:hypothetical protein